MIAGRVVGGGAGCVGIAEAGVNHDGLPERALELVDAAADAGADAVKFQTFKAESLTTEAAPTASYQRERAHEATQRRMLAALELPMEAFRRIRDRCEARGIEFLSTPFDEESATALAALGMRAIKVPSGEITNTRLLRHVAALRRPIILSTGMSSLDEVALAMETIGEAGHEEGVVLLHCVSCYPAEPDETNLRAMKTMRESFGVPVGLSDHSLGVVIPIAAVALGAAVIEKHLTLDRRLHGPDHAPPPEPDEMKEMIAAIRTVEAALGDGRKLPSPRELETAAVARRSLAAARDLSAGERLTPADVSLKRPGTGLPPTEERRVIGRTARVAIPRDALLSLDMFN